MEKLKKKYFTQSNFAICSYACGKYFSFVSEGSMHALLFNRDRGDNHLQNDRLDRCAMLYKGNYFLKGL